VGAHNQRGAVDCMHLVMKCHVVGFDGDEPQCT
jgi:hypothetical protein